MMRRLRRAAARAERRNWRASLGSRLFRVRRVREALSLPCDDVAAVRELTAKGALRQRLERLFLLLAYRIEPAVYYRCGLFEPERFRRAGDWVTHRQLAGLFSVINRGADREVTLDKRLFARHCETHGIASPLMLGDWTPETQARPRFFERLASSAAGPGVVCKPIRGTRGEGVRVICLSETDGWQLLGEGVRASGLSWPALRGALGTIHRPLLCQQRLANHHELAVFGTSPLHTLRLVTLRESEEVTPFMAAFRIGEAGAVADNFARGGTAAPVELCTGRLGRGTGATTRSLPLSRTHTASGALIEGVRLPCWREVLDLAATVHRSLDGFLFLAQDIAFSGSGPVIVEVNEVWTPHVLQKSHDVGLGQTQFPAAVLRALPRSLR